MPPRNLPTVDELAELVTSTNDSHSPLHELKEAVALGRVLTQRSDELLSAFVDRARAAGSSWHEIGNVLGLTRQGAHQRFVGRLLQHGSHAEFRFAGQLTANCHSILQSAAISIAENNGDTLGIPMVLKSLALATCSAGKLLRTLVDDVSGLLEQLDALSPEAMGSDQRLLEWGIGLGLRDDGLRSVLGTTALVEALEKGAVASQTAGRERLGTDFLLLGLTEIPNDAACGVLSAAGVTHSQLAPLLDL